MTNLHFGRAKAISASCRISQHHISEMEDGKRPIGKEIAKRLAEVLHIGYKVFFFDP